MSKHSRTLGSVPEAHALSTGLHRASAMKHATTGIQFANKGNCLRAIQYLAYANLSMGAAIEASRSTRIQGVRHTERISAVEKRKLKIANKAVDRLTVQTASACMREIREAQRKDWPEHMRRWSPA